MLADMTERLQMIGHLCCMSLPRTPAISLSHTSLPLVVLYGGHALYCPSRDRHGSQACAIVITMCLHSRQGRADVRLWQSHEKRSRLG